MKLRGALLLVVAATVCALSGLITPPEAAASVDAVNQWPAKPTIVSNSNTAAVSGTFTVGVGVKRLMLVAVAIESTTAPTVVAVTYGLQPLTQIVLNTTGANKLWVGYLNNAGIVAAGANKTLSANLTGAGTITATYVTAAVYAGVDQTTPVIGSGSLGTGTAALTIGPVGYTPSVSAINGNKGLSVYLVNWNNTTVGQTTPATGFTEVRDYIGTNFSLSANYKVKTGASAESITSTTTASSIAALAAVTLNPAAGAGALSVATVTTCGDCHGYPPQDGPYVTVRDVPPGQFPGAHSKHSGTDEGQYGQICTVCHKDNGTAPTGLKHADGFKNITGSGVPRNTYGGATNILMTDTTYTETCTKSTCHSTGRTTRQYAASPVWSGTTTCLSCHGGRNSSTGNPSRSVNNFSMSTSHSQHLKYLTTEMNCQTCHGKTAKDHTALKDYTGAIRHANGSKNVLFTEIAYGSYTSYKSPASGSIGTTKKCSNTACHGGTSRSAWSENAGTGGVNNDNTCVHCHGAATTTPADTNKKKFAPGWGTGTNKGISTDNYTSAKNIRVGAHFVHLSSVFMKQIKCNECHAVPSKPFEGNHLSGLRFNSQTLTFAQSSSARILIGVGAAATPSHLSAFAGYTSGTAVKAATCSSVYCHGSRLKTGDITGTDRKPAWNRDDLTNNTPGLIVCGRCHGNPPGGAHPVATATTGCGGCHSSVVNGTGVITNKNLHIDGRVQASAAHAFPYPGASHMSAAGTTPWASCNGCHSTTATGVTYAQWVASRTGSNAPNCRSCHLNGLNTPSGTSSCYDCHGATATDGKPSGAVGAANFPNYSASHTTHISKVGLTCANCHFGVGAGFSTHGNSNAVTKTDATVVFNSLPSTPTWTNATSTCSAACHGASVWGGRLKCIDCHAAAVSSPTAQALDATVTTRGNVVGEFTNTWSHKRSFTGSPKVVDADCVVCHMEGVKTTNAKSAVHGNGYVNLRDPDTGANIKNVTFGGTNAGSYTEGATDVTFVRFKRDFSKRLELDANYLSIAAVQQNHCLKCHDTAGATNANAQVPTTGTALKPFGVTITGHVAPFDSNGTGNVVDVNKSFLTSNSSYHPVRGKGNNWFTHYSAAGATASNMIAPWRGPFSTRGATVNVTSWGYLISCWDCHAPTGTTYASGVVTRSVTAHGATVTLRAPIRAAGTTAALNLCLNCHKVGYTVSSQHGTNTAFTSGAGDMGTSTFNNCSYCHAYGPAGGTHLATTTQRPLRGEDAHGFNDRTAGTVGSKFITSNLRPYAFIRNTLNPIIPKSTAGSGETLAAGTAGTCTGTAGTCNNNMGNDNYGGGTF